MQGHIRQCLMRGLHTPDASIDAMRCAQEWGSKEIALSVYLAKTRTMCSEQSIIENI